MSQKFYDEKETQNQITREQNLFKRLRENLHHLKDQAPALKEQLGKVDIDSLQSIADLSEIPVIRKSELAQKQQEKRDQSTVGERVFGGFSAVKWGDIARVYASPGPLYEPDSGKKDYWRFARSLYAAGIRPGMLVHNGFSYHFTPAGSMMETGALAVGCSVFPGGIGQTEQQIEVIYELKPEAYTGTPSFLKIILEKAEQLGVQLDSLKHALFSAEAYPPSLHQWFADRGIDGYQAYGSADVGLVAYETEAREGLVVAEDIILEIVKPGTNDPVEEGQVGEVVVTTVNPYYSLIRFGTGDLSRIIRGQSPCGRTNKRIQGWMGRADQSTKVRGMFIHPSQLKQILDRIPNVQDGRFVVKGKVGADELELELVSNESLPASQIDQLKDLIREVTKLRAQIKVVDSLPNDGLVIKDERDYS